MVGHICKHKRIPSVFDSDFLQFIAVPVKKSNGIAFFFKARVEHQIGFYDRVFKIKRLLGIGSIPTFELIPLLLCNPRSNHFAARADF